MLEMGSAGRRRNRRDARGEIITRSCRSTGLFSGKTVGAPCMTNRRLNRMESSGLAFVDGETVGFFGRRKQKRLNHRRDSSRPDLAVSSADYFNVPEGANKIARIILTIVGGRIVYAAQEFKQHSTPALPRFAVVVAGAFWRLSKSKPESGVEQCNGSLALGESRTITTIARDAGCGAKQRNQSDDLFGDDFGFCSYFLIPCA